MPTSDPMLLTPILSRLLRRGPRSILDVGIGFGKWGALAREYTDIWQRRFSRAEWTTKIHGVEAHTPYLSPHWLMYDRIFSGLIETVLKDLDAHYDMILFLEVLEHIRKPLALDVLSDLMARTGCLALSFSNFDQEVPGLPLESHVSRWTMGDLERFGHLEIIIDDGTSGLVLITP